MPADLPASSDADRAERLAAALGQLPAELRVVMARRPLSAAESAALAVGQLLPFEQPPDGAVELVVDGLAVARGVLVDVDGRRGVRITALADPS